MSLGGAARCSLNIEKQVINSAKNFFFFQVVVVHQNRLKILTFNSTVMEKLKNEIFKYPLRYATYNLFLKTLTTACVSIALLRIYGRKWLLPVGDFCIKS